MIVLQETHSLQTDELFWKNEWGGNVYFSHGTNDSCGVCILFKPSLNFDVVKLKTHNLGRYIILDILVTGQCITLVGVYGPNFFSEVTQSMQHFTCRNIIMCGDFNFVFDLNLDKMGGQQRTNFRARSDCLSLMATYNLVDIWRERHPLTKSYTWSSNILLGLHCRLDFFLISHHLSHVVNSLSQSPAIQ